MTRANRLRSVRVTKAESLGLGAEDSCHTSLDRRRVLSKLRVTKLGE